MWQFGSQQKLVCACMRACVRVLWTRTNMCHIVTHLPTSPEAGTACIRMRCITTIVSMNIANIEVSIHLCVRVCVCDVCKCVSRCDWRVSVCARIYVSANNIITIFHHERNKSNLLCSVFVFIVSCVCVTLCVCSGLCAYVICECTGISDTNREWILLEKSTSIIFLIVPPRFTEKNTVNWDSKLKQNGLQIKCSVTDLLKTGSRLSKMALVNSMGTRSSKWGSDVALCDR